MEAILNQILKAESSEQLGAEQYERSDERSDYRNGSRSLTGVDIVTSDDHKGLVKAIKEIFPNVSWQRCQVHFMRNILDKGFEDTMTIMALPEKYRKSLRISNIIERENREIRRRENVIQIFPNAASAVRLIGAILMDHHEDWIVGHRVFNMDEYFNNVFNIKEKIKQQKAA